MSMYIICKHLSVKGPKTFIFSDTHIIIQALCPLWPTASPYSCTCKKTLGIIQNFAIKLCLSDFVVYSQVSCLSVMFFAIQSYNDRFKSSRSANTDREVIINCKLTLTLLIKYSTTPMVCSAVWIQKSFEEIYLTLCVCVVSFYYSISDVTRKLAPWKKMISVGFAEEITHIVEL